MFDLFSDDITFCASPCEKTNCFRHQSNIKHPEFPHSFSFFKGTDICPDEKMSNPDVKRDDYQKSIDSYMKEFKKRTGMV